MAGTILDKTAIPYDGSDAAALAIDLVEPVLKAVGGSVHVVMVLDQYVQNELEEFANVEHLTIGQAAVTACERLVAAATDKGLEASFVVVTDSEVVDGLTGAVKDAGCTAIALPTHGFEGVTRWLMGNLRDRIVKSSSLPVLVLPPAN